MRKFVGCCGENAMMMMEERMGECYIHIKLFGVPLFKDYILLVKALRIRSLQTLNSGRCCSSHILLYLNALFVS